MNIKIGLIGPQGKLGKAIAALYPVMPIERTTSRQNLPCDVLIDVSSSEALLQNLSAKKPIVIGTTGHLDMAPIREAAQTLPVFYAANFSLGIALLNQLAPWIARHFPADIDVVETHHKTKKDAPSGTALRLAQELPGAKVHSLRSGKVLGEHALHFNNGDERVILSHEVFSRAAYARGALAAAHFLSKQKPGLYTMDNLFAKSVSSSSYGEGQNSEIPHR